MEKLIFMLILLSLVVLVGCSQHSAKPGTADTFDRELDRLVSDIIESCGNSLADLSPFSVVSANAVNGRPYTGLDDIICSKLSQKLAGSRETVTLSRENWFELKTFQTISFKGHPVSRERLIRDVVVFIVSVEPEPVFNRVRVSVFARNRQMNTIPGIKAAVNLAYFDESPAFVLYHQKSESKPYPRGLEQHPYHSIEEMVYSMASELSHAARSSLRSSGVTAKNEELRIVLCTRDIAGHDGGFRQAVTRELQQAMVAIGGITTAVSRKDMGPVFAQMNFYKQNVSVFEQEFEKFTPGTVILLVETQQSGNRYQAALRAVWRVSPLEDTNGNFIVENRSGVYLSGFTSRAWFKGAVPRQLSFRKIPGRVKTYIREPAMGFD